MVEYRRSIENVVASDSLVFPFQGLCPDYEEPRRAAIVEVLRRIPESDFQKLEEGFSTFHWYIPNYEALAAVEPFYCTHQEEADESSTSALARAPYSRVIFLSPRLADVDFDVAVAAVSHELAHIVLDHDLEVPPDKYSKQEDEAWALVDSWGFAAEAKAHEKYCAEREGR